ncbi:hypothetical protein EVAR_22737_1 [Eumeta japonica]|uniref:Uncharacterized protein n=1 Tax=Eumeta variegata TaxID=151549 RepID=A0A4C1USD7_EUMVA|nr:hypothetical protein EVAR_22737_1 [Eumeta japonica]
MRSLIIISSTNTRGLSLQSQTPLLSVRIGAHVYMPARLAERAATARTALKSELYERPLYSNSIPGEGNLYGEILTRARRRRAPMFHSRKG